MALRVDQALVTELLVFSDALKAFASAATVTAGGGGAAVEGGAAAASPLSALRTSAHGALRALHDAARVSERRGVQSALKAKVAAERRYCFEHFKLRPIVVLVSFASAGGRHQHELAMWKELTKVRLLLHWFLSLPFSSFLCVSSCAHFIHFTSLLSSPQVENAELRFAELELRHVRSAPEAVTSLVLMRYTLELKNQWQVRTVLRTCYALCFILWKRSTTKYFVRRLARSSPHNIFVHFSHLLWQRVLGSMDALGNPAGLLEKLGSGAVDFVFEPIMGVSLTKLRCGLFVCLPARASLSLFRLVAFSLSISSSVPPSFSVLTPNMNT